MKNDRIFIGIFICIFIIGIAGSVFVLRKSDGKEVIITRDGQELYRLDLTKYEKPYEIEIKGEEGTNKVLIENGRIRMSYADCPDNTCVKMGWLKSKAMPVVCLPHHIVINFSDDSDSPDGVTGLQGD